MEIVTPCRIMSVVLSDHDDLANYEDLANRDDSADSQLIVLISLKIIMDLLFLLVKNDHIDTLLNTSPAGRPPCLPSQ